VTLGPDRSCGPDRAWHHHSDRWQLVRVRARGQGASVPILAAYAAALTLTTPSFAKTPGETHCYNDICHRVKGLEEVRTLVGSETEAWTSFYDSAENDRFNTGTITSSGEEFDADSDAQAAASHYPDGTELLVWNPKNRRTAHIRINDFGPFYLNRTIDVTRGVAEKLEFTKNGVAKLRVIVIWAPNAEETRYRRFRVYPKTEGYLGRFDQDQLAALKHRLIAMGPARNGRPDATLVAAAQPQTSYGALPAFAKVEASNTKALARARLLNTPLIPLSASTANAPVARETGALVWAVATQPTSTVSAGSPQAIATLSPPAGTITAEANLEVAATITGLEREIDTATQTSAETQTVAVATLATASEAVAARVPTLLRGPTLVRPNDYYPQGRGPNTVLWQQFLIGLGLLSGATLVWRTRRGSPRLARARATPAVPSSPQEFKLSASAAVDFDHSAGERPGFAANIVSLPYLPTPPATKTAEQWRDAALDHMQRYEWAQAETAYRALLAAREADETVSQPMLASAERQLADCLREQGRYAAAEQHYARALTMMSLAVGDHHPATADILDEYAISILKQGRAGQAEILAKRALVVRRAAPALVRELAITHAILAEAYRAQGQLLAAESAHRDAWAKFLAVSGADSLECAASMTSLGVVLGELGQVASGEELLNAGTRIFVAQLGQDHPATATGYALLGELYTRAQALDAAVSMHDYALSIRMATLGGRHPDTVESLLACAMTATLQYRMETGRALLDQALDAMVDAERSRLGPQSKTGALLAQLLRHHQPAQPLAMAAE
jgi:rare lipoprotein A (peptidoglycan hydrolase)